MAHLSLNIIAIKLFLGVIMSSNLTLAEWTPIEKKFAAAYELFLILGSSLLIALSAQVALGWPVPITGQTFAILLIASVLGSKRASLAVLAYICEGVAGLPVFAQFKFGLTALLVPQAVILSDFSLQLLLSVCLLKESTTRNSLKRFLQCLQACLLFMPLVFYGSALS